MIGATTMNAADEVLLLVAQRARFYRRTSNATEEECQRKGTSRLSSGLQATVACAPVDQRRHINTVYRCICGEPGQMHDAGSELAPMAFAEREERLTQICLVPVEDVSYLTGVADRTETAQYQNSPRENKMHPDSGFHRTY